MSESEVDVVVIGGGLGGLFAALACLGTGRSVLVLEQGERAGGRCGVATVDGYEFTIGCNDFGCGIVERLASVGVELEWQPSTTRIDLGDCVLDLPPSLATAARLVALAPALWRLVRAVKRGDRATLLPILRDRVKQPRVEALVALLAYATGTSLSRYPTASLVADFSPAHGYGLHRPLVPASGPQSITDALVEALVRRGGRLELGTRATGTTREGSSFIVHTDRGDHVARRVIAPGSGQHTAGLEASQILLAVPATFPFVKARCLIVAPPDPERRLQALDAGHSTPDVGFHLFRDRVATDHYTITGFCLSPRGCEPSESDRAKTLECVLDAAERHLPGLREALRYARIIGPAEYRRRYGVSSVLSVRPASDGLVEQLDEHTGVIRYGNGFGVPGQHANAAIASGLRAAELACYGPQ